MNELSADNVLDYLRVTGHIGPGPARAELLGGGVSNVVLRVTAAERAFVLKQSRPQLRTKAPWFSDPERIYREQEVMEALHPLLPAGTVPAVLFADRPNYLFAMEHAPAGARVWKERLLAGDINLSLGEKAGAVLGRVHDATGREPDRFRQFADGRVFTQLRIDPFYRRVVERHPDFAAAIGPLVEGMLTRREALCHGDFSPKNILATADGFMLVDYETAYLGEPAMDLGFFQSHLLLKAIKLPGDRPRIFDLTRAFWRGYSSVVSYRPADELFERAVGHLGVCLLARVDGTSPVDYLTEERQRDTARRLGRRLLRERPLRCDEVLGSADAEFRI
jgi:aminoglycoside phosphotransferase (APT) family kinase protein